jgi:hypothetical protein
MANGTFKMKMDIDRHGPRLMPNICKNLNPHYFLLPSTFKKLGMIWKDRSYSSSFKQENPRDKPVLNLRDLGAENPLVFEWVYLTLLSAVVKRDVYAPVYSCTPWLRPPKTVL